MITVRAIKQKQLSLEIKRWSTSLDSMSRFHCRCLREISMRNWHSPKSFCNSNSSASSIRTGCYVRHPMFWIKIMFNSSAENVLSLLSVQARAIHLSYTSHRVPLTITALNDNIANALPAVGFQCTPPPRLRPTLSHCLFRIPSYNNLLFRQRRS